MTFEYQTLSIEDRSRLRLERIRALEGDLCRIELALEDALSDAERDDLYRDAEVIHRRLRPHYAKMGLIDSAEDRGGPDDPGVSGDGLPAAR
jgi:hypothetical protein